MKIYEVNLEIAGFAAMFTRPDSGAAQVSYPVPTFSAAKGMFEAIACLRGDKIIIIKEQQPLDRQKSIFARRLNFTNIQLIMGAIA